jgi:hypothetical protein
MSIWNFFFCCLNAWTLFLKQFTKDHHQYFLTMYPDRQLKPKHHFITHYPHQICQLGPLITYWTMRFEAKHRFFKRLGHIVCNYRNILKMLAEHHKMFLLPPDVQKRPFGQQG